MNFKNFFNPKPEDFFKKIDKELRKVAKDNSIDLEKCQVVTVHDETNKKVGFGFSVDGKLINDFVRVDDINIIHSYTNYIKARYDDRLAKDTAHCARMIDGLHHELERKHGKGLAGIKLALVKNHLGARGFAYTKDGEIISDVISAYDAVILKLSDTIGFEDQSGFGEE